MLLNKQIHSLANPVRGSAAFAFGTKEADAFVTFSVGTPAIPDEQYLTTADNGDYPTMTIKDGILTFSVPQVHDYVGVGDCVITYTCPEIFLNKKISSSQWHVKREDGSVPDDVINPVTVASITKAFVSLHQALSDTGPGLFYLYGTKDLASRGTHVRLACYEMTEDVGANSIEFTDWITAQNAHIYIYTPTDIKTECNKSQRFKYDGSDGYVLTGTSTIMRPLFTGVPSGMFIDIDGLVFDNQSSVIGKCLRTGIVADGFRVLNCIFRNGDVGLDLSLNESTDTCIINCKFYNLITYGIDDHQGSVKVYNANFYNCGSGIRWSWVTRNRYVNCIFELSTADGVDKSPLENCISSDASVFGGTDCHPNVATKFIDSALNDFRLHPNDDTAYLNGQDLSNDSYYSFNLDICGNTIDDTWCIGAHHYTPTLYLSIDKNQPDLKTGTVDVVVTDSEAVFSVNQTNDNLCGGCVVVAGTTFYLWKKINNTTWMVVDGNGKKVADAISSSVVSISAPFDNLYEAIHNGGAGYPGTRDIIGSEDLITEDTNLVLAFISGRDVTNSVMQEYDVDSTRHITLKTLTESSECNTSLRHGVLFNTNKYYFDGNAPLEVTCSYTVIEGLQFSAVSNGIKISSGINIIIDSNIIHSCGQNGILWDSNDGADKNIIVNNLIYKCLDAGVKIAHNFGNFASGKNPIAVPTTTSPTTVSPTTVAPVTTTSPTTASPTTVAPVTTAVPTTASPTTVAPVTTAVPTTTSPTTVSPTTVAPVTTASPTTVAPVTTASPTTPAPASIWQIQSTEKSSQPNTYCIRVINGASPEIIWTKGALTIITDGRTPESLFEHASVTGAPWGILTAITNSSDIETFDWTPLHDFDDFVAGSSGSTSSYFFIYQNLVAESKVGFYIESIMENKACNVVCLKNNISQNSTDNDFTSSANYQNSIISESNISSDYSLNRFNGKNDSYEHTIKFKNSAIYDFRLTLYDVLSMCNIVNLSADVHHPVLFDYIGTSRKNSYRWTAGCDNYSYALENSINFSVGGSYPADLGGAGLNLYIKNSILTFLGSSIDPRIGVGDKITYDSGSKVAYIAEKGTDFVWRVVDNVGAPIIDQSLIDTNSISRVFNDLASSINGAAASTGLYTELGSVSDLVSSEYDVCLWCYADSIDTDIVFISGWITNSDYRITILTPWNTYSQSIVQQRHSGKWDSGYAIQASVAGSVISIDNDWITIEGILIKPNDNTQNGIHVYTGRVGITVRGNIIKDSNIAIWQG